LRPSKKRFRNAETKFEQQAIPFMTEQSAITPRPRNFASDNNAPVCPTALQAWESCNHGHAPAYGEDHATRSAIAAIHAWFESQPEVYFLTGGTSANCLAIASSLQSYHAVICHEYAHIQTDECHAPGFFKPGIQLRTVSGHNGKLSPESLEPVFSMAHGIHGTLPGMVSITQSTEAGTVYSQNELSALATEAHRLELFVHMDGARFANALAATGESPASLSWKSGVDLLSLGGVKNGMGFGEVLIVFNPEAADRLDYRIKQSGQLMSKMRYLSAPWEAMIRSGQFLANASHSNAMARLLAKRIGEIPKAQLLFPVQANAVFCALPEKSYQQMLERGWRFYPFPQMGGYRLMCSWDTTEGDVHDFANDLNQCIR
jgi:threonine aldolase